MNNPRYIYSAEEAVQLLNETEKARASLALEAKDLRDQISDLNAENIELKKCLAEIEEREAERSKGMNIDEYNSMVEKIRTKKEWFDPFMRLCAGYYATNPCGGSLHIVLDDGNLENTHIDWCAGYAYGTGDMVGSRIASLMREMTMSQRRKVYANYGRYSGGTHE